MIHLRVIYDDTFDRKFNYLERNEICVKTPFFTYKISHFTLNMSFL